jgi:hypothetical protein
VATLLKPLDEANEHVLGPSDTYAVNYMEDPQRMALLRSRDQGGAP